MYIKINIVCLVLIFSCSSKELSICELENQRLKSSINATRYFEDLEFSNEGLYIDNFSMRNSKGDTLFLHDDFFNNKLIFRFTYQDCNVCIYQELELIKNRFDSNNVAIIADFPTDRKLNVFKSSNNINYDMFSSLDSTSLPEKLELSSAPYCFILFNNRILKLHVGDIDSRNRSERYFDALVEFFKG